MMDIDVKTSISKQGFGVQNIEKKIPCKKYELEVTLEDKVYTETYYIHQPRSVAIDETLAKINS